MALSVAVLARVAEAAFKANGFPHAGAQAVHVRDLSDKTLRQVHEALVENEKSAGNFILANFNQKAYTDDSDAISRNFPLCLTIVGA